MELFVGIVVMVIIILAVSKVGDIALDHGKFWLFLVLSIVGTGLFLAARAAIIAAAKHG